MNFQEVVQQELNNFVESGKVTEIIRTHLEKTLNSIASDALREYGDFGKQLKDAVQKSLQIDLEKVKIIDYNSIVTTIFNEQVQKFALEKVQEPMQKLVDSYSGLLEKKTWKLSEIVEKFIEEVKEDHRHIHRSGEITLIVEESNYGSMHVYLDVEEDIDPHKCEYHMHIDSKEGYLYSFEAGKYRPYGPDIRVCPIPKYGFAGFLFKLYASQSTIKAIEKYECETSWSTD